MMSAYVWGGIVVGLLLLYLGYVLLKPQKF